MNIQGWFPFRSDQSLSCVRLFATPWIDFLQGWLIWMYQFSPTPHSLHPALTSAHDYWKNHSFDYIHTFVSKVTPLLFNMLSRLLIVFLPRSKCLLISWLQSLSTVISEPEKRKSVAASTFCPSIHHEVTKLDAMIFIFWMLRFKPAFTLSSFTLIKRIFSSSSLFTIRVVSSAYLSCWYFFNKGTIVFMRVPPLWPNCLLKVPPKPLHYKLEFQYINLDGGTQTFSS